MVFIHVYVVCVSSISRVCVFFSFFTPLPSISLSLSLAHALSHSSCCSRVTTTSYVDFSLPPVMNSVPSRHAYVATITSRVLSNDSTPDECGDDDVCSARVRLFVRVCATTKRVIRSLGICGVFVVADPYYSHRYFSTSPRKSWTVLKRPVSRHDASSLSQRCLFVFLTQIADGQISHRHTKTCSQYHRIIRYTVRSARALCTW